MRNKVGRFLSQKGCDITHCIISSLEGINKEKLHDMAFIGRNHERKYGLAFHMNVIFNPLA
jgi:hypothetical protein